MCYAMTAPNPTRTVVWFHYRQHWSIDTPRSSYLTYSYHTTTRTCLVRDLTNKALIEQVELLVSFLIPCIFSYCKCSFRTTRPYPFKHKRQARFHVAGQYRTI